MYEMSPATTEAIAALIVRKWETEPSAKILYHASRMARDISYELSSGEGFGGHEQFLGLLQTNRLGMPLTRDVNRDIVQEARVLVGAELIQRSCE
jgi:hypothetical protein